MEELVTHFRDNFIIWLFVLMWIDTMGLPLPSEVPLLFGGYLISQGELNIAAATLVSALGATCGSLLAYFVSERYGRAAILRWGRVFFITEEHLHTSERWFEKHGEAAVFICRMVPLARTLISIPAGIAEMKVPRFAVYSFAGTVPWSIGLMVFGWALGPRWKSVLGSFTLAGVGVGLVLLAGGIWWYLRRRRAAREGTPSPDTEQGSHR